MAVLFFSYSHRDEALRDQLETHLAMLKRQGFIETWHDRRITAGEELDDAISRNLEAAEVILLLVSPDFLASEYCYGREMARAMERHNVGQAKVIPIILRPCDWHAAPFGKLLAVPRDGKPITQWPDVDIAMLDVVTSIKAALKAAPTHRFSDEVTPTRSSKAPSKVRRTDIRSSNLRVSKNFTDKDKEQFLHDAFEYVAKFFDNSLIELSKRHSGIEGTFRRIDANRFTSVVYREGGAVSRCTIFLDDRFGGDHGIAYSNSDAGNGYNERLSIESDNQRLYLRALGMARFGRADHEQKLSQHGGAELFWEMFISSLQ